MAYNVGVVIEKDENGYYVFCPAPEGCQSPGDTFKEASHNIKEAIELYLKTIPDQKRTLYLRHEIYTISPEVHVA